MSNTSQPIRKTRPVDTIPTIVVIGIIFGCMYLHFTHPDWQPPSGFGPEWQCTGGGARAGSPMFCIKKSLLNSANQTAPKS